MQRSASAHSSNRPSSSHRTCSARSPSPRQPSNIAASTTASAQRQAPPPGSRRSHSVRAASRSRHHADSPTALAGRRAQSATPAATSSGTAPSTQYP
ncbi:hypothetical protein [Kitasatospora sp. CB02891]|uniref:hypothetical protein n=1 Tax=Kitasatospora sp. CB02891 TaxID=2020329 RepID=UPI0012FE0A3D|nr:hypothetical protein [Kitasatospora sp. CB02891]